MYKRTSEDEILSRYHLGYLKARSPYRSPSAPLSCNGTNRRDLLLAVGSLCSGMRLTSPSLSARTNRRLSENAGTRPSSSSPLFILLLKCIIASKKVLSTTFNGILFLDDGQTFSVGQYLSGLVKMLKMGEELKNHSPFSMGKIGMILFF